MTTDTEWIEQELREAIRLEPYGSRLLGAALEVITDLRTERDAYALQLDYIWDILKRGPYRQRGDQ